MLRICGNVETSTIEIHRQAYGELGKLELARSSRVKVLGGHATSRAALVGKINIHQPGDFFVAHGGLAYCNTSTQIFEYAMPTIVVNRMVLGHISASYGLITLLRISSLSFSTYRL